MLVSPPPVPGQGRAVKTWMFVVPAVIGLGLALFVPIAPWYTVNWHYNNLPGASGAVDASSTWNFFPGSDLRYDCATNPANASPGDCTGIQAQGPYGVLRPYSSLAGKYPLPTAPTVLGTLYSSILTVSITIGVLGGAAVALLGYVSWRRTSDRRKLVVAALVLAIVGVVALGAVFGVMAYQPTALAQSAPGFPGPNSTFWGSCGPVRSGCFGGGFGGNSTVSSDWGPSIGWYSELTAGTLFVIAAGLLFRQSKVLPQTPSPTISRAP